MKTAEIDVVITFAGAGTPFKRAYPETARISQALSDALTYFGLTAGGDGAGNQIVFYLYRGADRAESSTLLSALSHAGHLQLKLVREVVAG